MTLLIILFGLLGDCFLSALVGILGSRRRIGFGWAFLLSLVLTPFVGLIFVLLSDPLPTGDRRWGCIGTLLALVAIVVALLFLFAAGGVLATAAL